MSELALFLVRIGFVAVLWVFILSLLSVIRADLYGRRVISRIARQNAPQLAVQLAALKNLKCRIEFMISQLEAEWTFALERHRYILNARQRDENPPTG